MFEVLDTLNQQAVIKVIGVGGGGGNAVDHMQQSNIEGVEFVNANTDVQALQSSPCSTVLQLGSNLTKGLGAGADPDVGRQAAMEDRDRIAEVLSNADMVFVTAGMGGGTGTGAAPVIAEIAKELGILTVAVVTQPFRFEGQRRTKLAEQGLRLLQASVDSLITIPNDKLIEVMGKDALLQEGFAMANDVLHNAVSGISELITRPGLINVDFADVKTVMLEMGQAIMGSAIAEGDERAAEAAKNAINSPLLEGADIRGAKGLLINVCAAPGSLKIGEFDQVGRMIEEMAAEEANVVIGTSFDENMGEALRVTMVAAGIEEQIAIKKPLKQVMPRQRKIAVNDTTKFDHNDDALEEIGLLSRSDMKNATELPVYQDNAESELDVPTFLRRQAD